MQNARRKFMQHTAVGALAVASLGCAGMQTSERRARRPVVLVHGAFIGAWAFQPVVPELAARGFRSVVTVDLPGHGLNARFPASYFTRPLVDQKFGTEPSPQAGITLDDNVNVVLHALEALSKSSSEPVVLVGHSMGGQVTAVAEKAPERIAKLVYLTAFLTKPGVPAIAYI